MSDTGLNTPPVRALFEVNVRLAELAEWVMAAPYMIDSEDTGVDVGQQILNRIHETRALGMQHLAKLAAAAGVPSPAVVAALEASLEGEFSSGTCSKVDAK
jgi:hypothetical protein